MPSFWDSAKNAISKTLGRGLAAPAQAILGIGAGMTEAKVAPISPVAPAIVAEQAKVKRKEVEKTGKKFAKTAVDVAAKPAEILQIPVAVDKIVEEATKFYEWAYPKIARPVSTALLTSADVLAGEGANLGENWQLAQEVSPGQAYANYTGTLGEALGVTPFLENKGIDLPEFLQTNFNIANPDSRKKAFQDELAGRIFSGSTDGFLNFFLDPLVIGGKGLKFGRIIGLDRPIMNAEDVVRLRSELDAHGLWLKSGGKIGRETPMGVVAERLTKGDNVSNYDDVFVKRSSNRSFLADVTGEAKTYDEVADIIAAASGDTNSYNRLVQTRASVADEIDRMKDILSPIEKRYNDIPWGQATKVEQHLPTVEEYQKYSNILEDLKRRDANLAKAIDENIGDYRIINNYTSAADVQLFDKNLGVAIEKARAKASEAYHATSFFTEKFQKNPFTRPVTVVSLPFNKLPRGIVRVDGGPVSDSFNEIKYALNSVKVLRGMEYAPIKNDLARNYLNARNANERMVAIKDIETEVADIIALENDIPLDEARKIYAQYGQVRRGLMSSIQNNGFYIDDAGEMVTSPFWKAELANIVPMMDFRDFDKFLKVYKNLKEPGVKARAAAGEFTEWLDFANSWFKVSVLTRLGYPVRNTLDGQLRAALVLNSLAVTEGSVRRFATNLGTRAVKAKNFFEDSLKIQRPDQLNTYTGRLVYQKNQYVAAREAILDELTPQNYYAGAAGKFGKQIDPQEVNFAIKFLEKNILSESERGAYLGLLKKRKSQDGLLFGKDRDKFKKLQSKAFGNYVRKEVVPTLPKGTTLVYADYPSGKIFYKIPGTKGRLPKEAIPDIKTRKGLPSAVLYDELINTGKMKLRGRGPVEYPDIRVITDYDLARKGNFEEIADIIPEDQIHRVRFFTQQIDNMENQIVDKIEQAAKLNAIRSELKIVRGGEGQVTLTSPNGRQVKVAGPFDGPNGDIIRKDVSSASSLNWATENQAYLTFDAQKGVRSSAFEGTLGGKRVRVEPTDPQYYNEMAEFANKILRNDQLAMRILKGESDQAIRSWLKTDGRFYLKEIDADVSNIDIPAHIAEARARINRIFPDQQVRNLIAREELTPSQFDILMRGNPNLAPIAGRELVEDTLRYGQGVIKRTVNDSIDKVFKVIGSTPEDNLVAWPFYNKLYLKNLQQEINIAEGLGKSLTDKDLILQLQRSAHDQTRKTVLETLYRVQNNTSASSLLRFLIPFFNAQYNAIKVYGKLIAKDPSLIGRIQQVWNLPNRVAQVIDQNGNQVPAGAGPSTQQYLLINVPAGLEGKFGLPKGYDITIPKNSLNVFLQGENPLFPSFGIPVTIPVSAIANSRPDKIQSVEEFLTKYAGETIAKSTMSTIMPFGRPAQDPWKLLLPASGQKIVSINAGLDDATYARTVGTAMKVLDWQWRQNGMVGKRPTFKDGQKVADQIYEVRIAANLILPFTFSFRPDFQIVVDDWRRAMADPNIGPNKIDEYILTQWGVAGYMVTAPTSRNRTGVFQTVDAVRNAKEFSSLIGKMDRNNTPGVAGFIANFGTSPDKYSDAAANWFRDKDLRKGGDTKWTESRVTEDILKDREISLGWTLYQKEMAKRDAQMLDLQIYNINSSAAEAAGIKDDWNNFVANLSAQFPAWGREKEMGDFDLNKTKRYVNSVMDLVSDKKFMNRFGNTSTMQAMSRYIETRTYVAKELQLRKEEGGSGSFNSEDNIDLKDKWDEFVVKLKAYDKPFADFYTRYLDSDTFGVINR